MAEHYLNLIELFESSTSRFAGRPLFGTKVAGHWQWLSYGDFRTMVNHLRGGLASLGIGPGDRVAIVSRNRVEWAAAAYAAYGLGAAFVPMYEAQLPREWRFILSDSNAKAVFAGTEEIRLQLERLRPELPSLESVVGVDQPQSDALSYRALVERGRAAPVTAVHPSPSTIAGVIYTSGTTGLPKGVLLTHENIASNVGAVHDFFDFGEDDRSLSFLPWAHAYGQTCELHGMLSMGSSIAINESLPKLLDDLKEVQPTILIAVPRVFTRLYTAITRDIEMRPRLVRKLVHLGLRAAIRRGHGEHLGPIEGLGLSIDERMVFSKIRVRLGGNLRYAISAAASLSLDVAEFIDALGIAVYEGYGLTEASPIVSANYPGHRKLGSVGKVIPGVMVRIEPVVDAQDGTGEIIVYGPNVMKGYHNRPEETDRVFTRDGGLRTGDLGRFDDDGYLFVTGRIKDQYKLENGKYVMPGPLEEALKLSPYIANVMLYGENRPYNIAVVVPDRITFEKWAKERGLELGDIASNQAAGELLHAEVHAHSRDFKHFEVPKQCLITADDFTAENALLTPTLKLKRSLVAAKYAADLDRLYARAP